MAVKTSLRRVAERLSSVIRSFAAGEGFDQDEVVLAGAFDPESEQIYLFVASLRPIDEVQWYSEIRRRIREQFGDSSPIPFSITLRVQQVHNVDQASDEFHLADNEIDLTEML